VFSLKYELNLISGFKRLKCARVSDLLLYCTRMSFQYATNKLLHAFACPRVYVLILQLSVFV
jgi:hypothetical protein